MKTESKFLTRAGGLPRGSMINEGGKVKVDGTDLVVDTPHGKWTLAFLGKEQLSNDLKNLAGLQVTCIYNAK